MTIAEILAVRKQRDVLPKETIKPPEKRQAGIIPISGNTSKMVKRGATFKAESPDELTANNRAKALERLKFVRLVDQVKRERLLNAEKASDFVESHYSDLFPLLSRAGKYGKTALQYNNYRNWSQKARIGKNDGERLMLLADGYAAGKMDLKGPEQFWEVLRAAWLNLNKLPMTVAYDVAVKRMRQIDPAIWLPTYNMARYHLQGLRKDLVILSREGEVSYKNHCMDYIVRDWDAIVPGSLIIGDNRTFDTRIKIWDETKQKWIAVRPTICAMIDAASWYFAAWAITPFSPNAGIIINTLAQYCAITGGPPERAYFDNGHDFCARGFSTPLVTSDSSEHSIFMELGISLTNSVAYNARAKTIEMAFHEMMMRFDKFFADYLGSRPGQRTMGANWFDKHPEELPTLQQFTEKFNEFLSNWHTTPKKGIIHKGMTPEQIWMSRPPQAVISPDCFRLSFARPIGEYTVGRGPSVTIRGVRYISDEIIFGEKVLIKTDPTEENIVYCYTLRGQFIGTATRREPISAIADGIEDREGLKRELHRQYRQLKDAKTTLRDATGGLHVLSPGELLKLPPAGSTLVKLGDIVSVKGSSHRYSRYALPQAEDPFKCENKQHEQRIDPELANLITETRHAFEEERNTESTQKNDDNDYCFCENNNNDYRKLSYEEDDF